VTVTIVATVLAESVLVLMVLLEEVEVLLPIITTFGTGCCGAWCFLLARLPPADLK
jgi:hypothetical protein